MIYLKHSDSRHRSMMFMGFFMLIFSLTAQEFPKPQMMRKFKADSLILDTQKSDGSFKFREKNSQKWGLHQWLYRGLLTRELIPTKYDSLDFIPYNGSFTAVYQQGKVGIYLSPWVFENAVESVACQYDDHEIRLIETIPYLAVKKQDRWIWVDWQSGTEYADAPADTPQELSPPNFVSSSGKNAP